MPGDDADFAAYLAARWPSLVRTLVLLGCGRARGRRGRADRTRALLHRAGIAYAGPTTSTPTSTPRSLGPAPAPAPGPGAAGADRRCRRGRHRRGAAAPGARGRARPARRRRAGGAGAAVRRRAVRGAGRRRARRTAGVRAGRITHGLGRMASIGARASAAEIFRRASESIEVPAAAGRRGRRRGPRRSGADRCARRRRRGGGRRRAGRPDLARDPRAGATTDGLSPAAVTKRRNPVRRRVVRQRPAAPREGRRWTVPAVTDLVELNGGAVYGDQRGDRRLRRRRRTAPPDRAQGPGRPARRLHRGGLGGLGRPGRLRRRRRP